jgi:dimethylamine monooxygenase subunit A
MSSTSSRASVRHRVRVLDTEMRYEPWSAGPFRHRLALRPLDPADWLHVGPDFEHDVALKRRIADDHADVVVRAIDGTEAACDEVLDEIATALAGRVPDGFVAAHRERALHPIDIAGRLVQEDLLVMVERGGHLVLGAASVCFPNRWDLAAKVGRSMAEIHDVVPRLNEQLGATIDAFLARLAPDKPFWRLGWGVLDLPDLYQPEKEHRPPPPEPLTPDSAGHTAWVRIERETLRRMPIHGSVLFTIRTVLRPLADAHVTVESAQQMIDALAALPDDVADYKQMQADGIGGVTMAWLAEHRA